MQLPRCSSLRLMYTLRGQQRRKLHRVVINSNAVRDTTTYPEPKTEHRHRSCHSVRIESRQGRCSAGQVRKSLYIPSTSQHAFVSLNWEIPSHKSDNLALYVESCQANDYSFLCL